MHPTVQHAARSVASGATGAADPPLPPGQQSLFADQPSVEAAVPGDELRALAERLPRGLRLGTSSWAFAGWAGLVYRGPVEQTVLAREGLRAYANHPLFATVSIDRSYYQPLDPSVYRGYAESVPAHFRFMVKAHADLTTPWLRKAGTRQPNRRLLDLEHAMRFVVEPALEGLGAGPSGHLGVLLFQFPPLSGPILSQPQRFRDRVETFLAGLPVGPPYAVEIRNRELAEPDWYTMLGRHGVMPCVSVHPMMPDLIDQARRVLTGDSTLPVAVRWNLTPGFDYESA
ncbi:MAG: DUF72 domain-containing protein, partial [Gammaproteobacteria bacterium]|nr:DUF72 domain-containing protein [Gammaproteobacteria bacterium]